MSPTGSPPPCASWLLSGIEILISHPRFYGRNRQRNDASAVQLPIPSSRATVPTGYGYVLPDQNGWSRYLHFEAAWLAVLTGLLYVIFGLLAGISGRIVSRRRRPDVADTLGGRREAFAVQTGNCGRSRVVQRAPAAHVSVGDLRSLPVGDLDRPGHVPRRRRSLSGRPVTILGGQAIRPHPSLLRLRVLLVLFFLVHVVMVFLAGFRNRMRAMITGRPAEDSGVEMSKFSRRKLITSGIAVTAGASGLAVAARLAQRYGLIPPDAGGLRPWRNTDLRCAEVVDSPLEGA